MNPGQQRPEDESFLAVRSLKRQLLSELAETTAGPTQAELNDLLGRWPNEPAEDPDVAGLLFQDFRQRSVRGEAISRADYSQQFPEHRDSLGDLFRRQDFLRSMTSAIDPSIPTLSLPKIGDELFGFRLRDQLGQGAFARVFLAEQASLAARTVALKVSDTTGSEPQTLAQLQHTNIVPIYSVHEDAAAGIRAVCMPYFGGASLSQVLHAVREKSDQPASGEQLVDALRHLEGQRHAVLKSETSQPNEQHTLSLQGAALQRSTQLAELKQLDFPRACVWVVARLAEGLQHAHDRGVLHRDIKPSNVLIGGDGTPMLLDFNLAHDENQTNAQVEATLGGTVAYMAPEHLRALNVRTPELIENVDERSDIYGLGMVLFEMITGHNPFEQSVSCSPMPILIEAMAAERTRFVPSLRQLCPNVPWGLESIVRKCLAPDPSQRYQHASELSDDLNRWLEDRPLRFAPELSRSEQLRKWSRRHPRVAAAGIVTIVASCVLLLGWQALHSTQTRLTAARQRVVETEAAEAQHLKQQFERGTSQTLCLMNTHSELRDHAVEGRQVCARTLNLFGMLDDPNWQEHSAWKRLSAGEQRALAEDARELLLLLANSAASEKPNHSVSATPPALKILERAEAIRDLAPSAAFWRTKAAILRQLGESDEAKQTDEKADEIPPSSARDFYLLATTHLQSADPDRHTLAIRELRRALRLDPRHYWSWMQKGLCHLEMNEPQLALADFGVCVGLWPDFAWGYFNRAFALDRIGRKEAALEDYDAALVRDSKLLAALHNRGLARLELGQHAEALTDFDRLIELKRAEPVIHALRGQALEGLHRSAEADAAFAAAMDQLPSLPDPQQHQLLCSYAFAVYSRKPEQAEKAFARIPSDDPKFAEALYGRGMLATNANRTEQAIELFGRALERRADFEEARRFRAVLLARLGRFTDAIIDINTALQAAPQSGPSLYAAACVTSLAAEQAPTPAAEQQAVAESFRFLRQALARGYGRQAASDPDLKRLQQHPDFEHLLLP